MASIRETIDALDTLRPPTAPANDINKERKSILDGFSKTLLPLQLALVVVVLALLGYLVFPITTAHIVAVLLLATGIAVAFLVKK